MEEEQWLKFFIEIFVEPHFFLYLWIMKKIPLVLIVLSLLLLSSCKKDFSKITVSDWNPNVVAPFIQTELTLRNLMGVDSSLQTGNDSLMVFYYQRDSLLNITADSLVDFQDTVTSSYEFSLGDLMISDITQEAAVFLNDLLPYIDPSVADSLSANDGNTTVFPPFQLQSPVTVELPPIDSYETLTFSEGYFDIQITNQLPVTLTNLQYDIVDVVNNVVLKSVTVNRLDSGAVAHDTLFLKGKTLSNTFSYVINGVESDGSYPDSVFIDLTKGLAMQMNAREMHVIHGFAKIENQIIYATHQWVDLDFGDKKIREILFSGGQLDYRMQSYQNLTLSILLQLSSADVDGVVPENNFDLPANSFYEGSWSLANMHVDLTQDSLQDYNRMPIFLELVVQPANNMVAFDSSDKVQATFAAKQMVADWVKGNFGKKVFSIDSDTILLDLSFFDHISGQIVFDDPALKLSYDNGFGIPLLAHTNFYGVNPETGENVDLGIDSVVFNYPETVGETLSDSITYDKTNSNIVGFLAARPDKLIFSGEYLTNWNNDTANFATRTSLLTANAEVRVPLVFSTSSLVFTDTVNFLDGEAAIPVGSGALHLNVLNGLPFDLAISLAIPDSLTGEMIDHVDFDLIPSADVDAEGIVISPKESNVTAVFTDSFIQNMSKANTLLLTAKTVTAEGGTVPVGLYSDYKLKLAISFEAKVQP